MIANASNDARAALFHRHDSAEPCWRARRCRLDQYADYSFTIASWECNRHIFFLGVRLFAGRFAIDPYLRLANYIAQQKLPTRFLRRRMRREVCAINREAPFTER
jgi:hypothetical protein